MLKLPNIGYYGFQPTYVGQPIDEYKDYTKEIAKEYDTTRDKHDLINKTLSEINPQWEADKAVIDEIKNSVKTSIGGIAKDMQGGLRYETARNQIREISNKLANDPRITKIAENSKRKQLLDAENIKLNAEGKDPLRFSFNPNFSSVNPDGTLNDYSEIIQPKGEWDKAKLNVINRIKPTVTDLFDTFKSNGGSYIKTGSLTELQQTRYETFKNQMLNTYLDSGEGNQELKYLTEKGTHGGNMTVEQAKEKITKDLLDSAFLGTYSIGQSNYQQVQENEFDLYKRKQDYEYGLKANLKGLGNNGAGDNTGYFSQLSNLEAIPTDDKYRSIDENKFDENGNLKEIANNPDYKGGSIADNKYGSPANDSKSNSPTYKTTKERETLNKAKYWLEKQGFPKGMRDSEVNKIMSEKGKEILSRKVVTPDPDVFEALRRTGKLLTVDNLPLDKPNALKIVGSNGDTKTLRAVIGSDKVENVTFKGFSTVADKNNHEKPGDLVYDIKTKSGHHRVIQNLDDVDSDLAEKLQPINSLFQELYNGDLLSPKNLTQGRVFNGDKTKDHNSDLISFGIIGGTPDSHQVGLLPVLGYDSKYDKLTYELHPKFKVGKDWYNLNKNEIDILYNKGLINPEAKDMLDNNLMLFHSKSRLGNTLNFNDIVTNMRETIENHPYFVAARETAKFKDNKTQQELNSQPK